MMPSDLPRFTIRVSSVLLQKLRYIAAYNARSANREVELLIRRHVQAFEKEHGEIPLED